MNGCDIMRHETFVLYGAGSTGRDVLGLLRREGKRCSFFLDVRAKPGMQVEGIPVYNPEAVPAEKHQPDIPVVVTVFNRDVDVAEVVTRLRAHGWRTVVSFSEFHACYAAKLGDRFWLSDPALLEKDTERIVAAGCLWADAASRNLYAAILAARRSGRAEEMPRPNLAEVQYFPPDIPGWLPDNPLRFVDCGAYDGDTLRTMISLRLPVAAYAAFEPDMNNFSKLCAAGKSLLPPEVPAHLWPCGVSARAEVCQFAGGMGEASRLGDNGNGTPVPCVGLDEVLHGFRPNMIKMDIEGAEPQALLGAKELVAEHRPRLAISIYHCPDHLWNIPLRVGEWGCNYRLYLRVHGFNLFDIVLYAVPV